MTLSRKTSNTNTPALVLCGLFAALTAVCSFISIPLGFTPVPMNLGTLAVLLSGGLLGKKYGTISQLVYIALGAAGVPVFAGFRAGISVLAGPTGGYLLGYVLAAFVTGLVLDSRFFQQPQRADSRFSKKKTATCVCTMVFASILCYTVGTAWFMFSTGTGLMASLISCVFPFLIGDVLKIAAACLLTLRLRPHIHTRTAPGIQS